MCAPVVVSASSQCERISPAGGMEKANCTMGPTGKSSSFPYALAISSSAMTPAALRDRQNRPGRESRVAWADMVRPPGPGDVFVLIVAIFLWCYGFSSGSPWTAHPFVRSRATPARPWRR
ncbi:hypothetical protein GCM10029978_072580 [Actinoallomurus acanthiterrae]